MSRSRDIANIGDDVASGTVLTSVSDVASTKLTGTLGVDASGNVTVNSSGTTTPTYDYSTLGEGLHLRYWDQSGARHADIVATGNTPAGATQDLRFFTNSGGSPGTASERMRITSDGRLCVGTTTDDSSIVNIERTDYTQKGLKIQQTSGTVNFTIAELLKLELNAGGAETPFQRFTAGGSTFGLIRINSTNNGTQYLTTSDYRLKENVVDMTDSVTRLKQLRPVNFNFIGNDVLAEGFLAHEVQEVVPTAVAGSKDAVDEDGNINPQMIEMQSMVPLLTGALQEAITKIEELESRISALEA